jgi:hypothetical protein
MKVYAILYRDTTDDRCWDCNAGTENDYYRIKELFTDRNDATHALEQYFKSKHAYDLFYIEEFELK